MFHMVAIYLLPPSSGLMWAAEAYTHLVFGPFQCIGLLRVDQDPGVVLHMWLARYDNEDEVKERAEAVWEEKYVYIPWMARRLRGHGQHVLNARDSRLRRSLRLTPDLCIMFNRLTEHHATPVREAAARALAGMLISHSPMLFRFFQVSHDIGRDHAFLYFLPANYEAPP